MKEIKPIRFPIIFLSRTVTCRVYSYRPGSEPAPYHNTHVISAPAGPGSQEELGDELQADLQGRGGATGRAALGVTQKPIPCSQGMVFLMRSPLPRSRAAPQWCGSTRGQRREDAAACKGVGRAGKSIPEGSLGWAGEAAWLPHGHCSFRERDAAYPASLSAGWGGLPAPLRAPAPGGLRSFERSRCFAALTPRPQRGRSTVAAVSRGASLTQPRTPPLPPPFRVLSEWRGAPRHPLRIAAGMGRGSEARPPRRATGKSEQLLPGASRGDRRSPQGRRDRPRHRRPATCSPSPSGSEVAVATDQHHPRGQGSAGAIGTARSSLASHGEPRPVPSRPLPRQQRGRPRAAMSARPPPSVTAIGHRTGTAPRLCAETRRGRAPWGPPCAVPAATSAPPVQAKLHPFKLRPL